MQSTRPRKVIFDATSLRYLHTGLGQVSFHFLQQWAVLNPPDLQLHALVHPGLKNLVPEGIAVEGANYFRRHSPPSIQKYLYFGCDLWHMSTENTKLTGIPPGVPLILTIQGLHFLDEVSGPKAELELKKVQQLTDRATIVTVASKYTEDLVRKKLDLKGKSIQIIPYGVTPGPESETDPQWAPSSPFLFSVATFFERKNLHVLLPMMKELPEYKLILAGDTNRTYGRKIKEMISELGLGEQVILPGEISDKEKTWLYQHGEMLLFPSISEGFGIPVIEAFNFGKPVCCSRFGSLPEVGGALAGYWDNFEPGHMASVVRKALISDSSMAGKRKDYAGNFTWTKVVSRYIDLYRKILAGDTVQPSL